MLKTIVLLASLLSLATAHAYVTQKDVVYDTINGIPLKLDIYRPMLPSWKARPVLFFLHGGCYNAGSKNDIPTSAKLMADQGFVVVSIGYRLSQVAKYPAAVQDAQTAVRFMRKNAQKFNIDPKRMASYGQSAGGHLAAMLGVKAMPDRQGKIDKYSDRVQLVADWYGRTDFTRTQTEGFDCAVDFLGKPRNAQTMKDFEEASIMPHVDEHSAAFYIAHGTNDKQVAPIHSQLLHDKLIEKHQSVKLLWVTGAGHGFTTQEPWNKTRDFLFQLLK